MTLDRIGSDYEVWITDDHGVRIHNIPKWAFLNFTHIENGIGYANIGLTSDFDVWQWWQPDRRLEIWRRPPETELRLEGTYWLRKPKIYTRKSDNVTIIELSGRGPNALLERRIIAYASGTAQARKTATADDMMKAIVRENLGASATDADRNMETTGFFSIHPDASLGPTLTRSFAWRSHVLDVLRELSKASAIAGTEIFFRVVALSPLEFEFQTFLNQLGSDRSFTGEKPVTFGLEYNNLSEPMLELDYFDEVNYIYGGGQGEAAARLIQEESDDPRINMSIWNRMEHFVDAREQSTAAGLTSKAEARLREGEPQERFFGDFLNTPNSIYGRDWFFGDKVAVSYGGRQFDARIKVVYVSVNEDGDENITGQNELGAFLG